MPPAPTDDDARPRGLSLVALLLLLLVALVGLLAYTSSDEVRRLLGRETADADDAAAKAPKPAQAHDEDDDAEAVVVVSRNAQRAAGLATEKLAAAGASASTGVVANVPALGPLFDLRARYQAQQGDIAAARLALTKGAAELRRMQTLHDDDRNVSAAALEAAQAQNRSDRARLQQTLTAADATLDAIRQSWGRELADAVRGDDRSRLLPALAGREQVLVQVGIARAEPPPQRVWLSTIDAAEAATGGDSGAARNELAATLVGPAIGTDASLPSTTYLYRSKPGNLRSGARLRVRLEQGTGGGGEPDSGVLVPFSAVIWHGGRPWAYVAEGQSDKGVRFERRAVDTRRETRGGWIQSQHFEAGEEVVSTGAQWLLSKELKPRALDND